VSTVENQHRLTREQSMSRPSIAVVIPYYQVDPSLLPRAIRSVLAQSQPAAFRIIVVDDESPCPADQALSCLDAPVRQCVEVIRQPNAGPGAARNTALARIGDDTDYIAYLDSDDMWTPHHIAEACRALSLGADVFFSDRQMWSGKRLFTEVFKLDEFDPIPGHPSLRRLEREADDCTLRGIIQMSSLVLRAASFVGIRFPEDLWAHEDQYYELRLLQRAPVVLLSTEICVLYGRGVSIYSDTTYGSQKNLKRVMSEIKFRKQILSDPDIRLSPATAAKQRRSLRAARQSMGLEILHHVRRGRIGTAGAVIREEPMLLPRALAILASVGARKLTWRSTP
jgi:succinoglycan biosynthesis protein ExoW